MFLLMTDGAWHCQGTVGQACASSVPPAPLLCSPSTQTPNMHTLPCFLTWPISLEHWRTARPPLIPPPTFQCVCLSRAQSLSLSLSHTLACYFSCAAHCEDVCGQISMALAGRAGGSAPVLVLILRGDRAGVSGHTSNNSTRGH